MRVASVLSSTQMSSVPDVVALLDAFVKKHNASPVPGLAGIKSLQLSISRPADDRDHPDLDAPGSKSDDERATKKTKIETVEGGDDDDIDAVVEAKAKGELFHSL